MSNVKVYCRVRPQNEMETKRSGKKCVETKESSISFQTPDDNQVFTFDHVFNEMDNQSTVFEHVARPVVEAVMKGYNATVFAYGQTASGKTYSIEGASLDDAELKGIIPRAAEALFMDVMAADKNVEFIVQVSYVEIYMEKIRDLLDPYKTKTNLQIREDATRGIYVAEATEICVTTDEELIDVVRDGAVNRSVAATGMNEGSSRSHSALTITLKQRNLETQGTKIGKLVLVDLAGSEMVRKTKASGQQLEEAKTINKSLSALGLVINALTDPNSLHVPYRDSKLTRMLQESIGGNARTALMINVSPSSYNASETLSTLRFGNRAKHIQNKAVINEERSADEYRILLTKAEKAIQKQKAYIVVLEAKLSDDQEDEEIQRPDPTLEERLAQVENQLLEEKEASDEQQEEFRKVIDSLTSVIKSKERALEDSASSFEEQIRGLHDRAANERAKVEIDADERLGEAVFLNEQLALQLQESKLHSSTLAKENERLLAEFEIIEAGRNADTRSHDLDATEVVLQEHTEVSGPERERCTEHQHEIERLEWENLRKNMQCERRRWEDEISARDEKIKNLEELLEKAQMKELPASTGSGMSVRERQHMRSIQQKLEQLVGVHRQLLRKYASLELEHGEAKKRLALRDDRIKQLEGNTRMLAGNMRAQAERHVEELSRLREQVSQLQQSQNASNVGREFGAIRPIRGGGGKIPSASKKQGNAGGANFLTRLFAIGS